MRSLSEFGIDFLFQLAKLSRKLFPFKYLKIPQLSLTRNFMQSLMHIPNIFFNIFFRLNFIYVIRNGKKDITEFLPAMDQRSGPRYVQLRLVRGKL